MPESIQVARNGEVIGTLGEEEILEAVKAGQILQSDYIFKDGDQEWRLLGEAYPHYFKPPPAPPKIPDKFENPDTAQLPKEPKKKEPKAKKEPKPQHDWRQDPATEKQINYLESFGVDPKPGLTKGEASKMLDSLTNDPEALERQESIRRVQMEADIEDRITNKAHYFRKDYDDALKAIEEQKRLIAEEEDKEFKESLKEEMKWLKEDVKMARDERVNLWKNTFYDDNDDMDATAIEYYDLFGHMFKCPKKAEIQQILEFCDSISNSWDKEDIGKFYDVLETNFPDLRKSADQRAVQQTRSSFSYSPATAGKPAKASSGLGCVSMLMLGLLGLLGLYII